MTLDLFLAAGAVIVLASLVQSAAGFGFNMLAIPLLILLGFRSFEAITTSLVCMMIQTSIGVYALQKHIHWKLIAVMFVISGSMIPLGVLLLESISALRPGQVRQLFGAVVFIVVLAQWLWPSNPRENVRRFWFVIAMVGSGFLAGMAGMGGPPVVMWVMAHKWSTERCRATLWALFCALMPIQVLFLYLQFDADVLWAAGRATILVPVTLLGVLPGMWLGHRISKPNLRRVSYVMILLISFYAIVQPMLIGHQ